MKKNRALFLFLLSTLAACGGGYTYRKMRIELPVYSPLHREEFEQAAFGGFLITKEPEGFDLNKEIIEFLSPEFERKLHFQVIVQPVALASEEIFRKPDFWASLAPGSGRLLFITGKAELTREIRKSVLGRPRAKANDLTAEEKGIVERILYTLSLHLYLIRGDSGEIVLERDFKETKVYTNPKQRSDFAFYDLALRIKAKLFSLIMSEERVQERHLLLK